MLKTSTVSTKYKRKKGSKNFTISTEISKRMEMDNQI
jgi:hypothetical protein